MRSPHRVVLVKWMSWMILSVLVSGTGCVVTVHQPPVVTCALSDDVIMPCELRLSDDEKLVNTPVLYWINVNQRDNPRLWSPSAAYSGRVERLDENMNSANKSIVLKNVQWSDSGKYQCKLSLTTEKEKKNNSFRMKGNETLILVFDNVVLNLTNPNASRLHCQVNVSRPGHGFGLAIFHNGCRMQTEGFSEQHAEQPYTTLSESVSLMGDGKYECQLHHNEQLLRKSTFHYNPPDWDAGKNVSATCQPTISGLVVVFPEPWLLYISLLLVPITFLLGLLTARLIIRV